MRPSRGSVAPEGFGLSGGLPRWRRAVPARFAATARPVGAAPPGALPVPAPAGRVGLRVGLAPYGNGEDVDLLVAGLSEFLGG
ncbi:hypothetical protein [Streptomyces wuyuanensis]|uniref:hypothetical protein n=1 Tax=Streptomyces wuyuanensis TaxID=1196353 RepID=UPI003435A097